VNTSQSSGLGSSGLGSSGGGREVDAGFLDAGDVEGKSSVAFKRDLSVAGRRLTNGLDAADVSGL